MQPLFTPDGVVQSVMRRDTVLAKALREKGLTLKFYPFHKGIDINYFMKRGDIDIGMAGESPVMSASATSDMVIAALMQQGASAVVAPKRITTLRGLKGRRIGYPEGSTADLGLLIAFSAIGLDEQSVTLVPMEIANLLPALENGQIDAFSAWEPLVSHALADNTNRSAVSKFLVSSFLYMNRSFLERNPYAAEQIAAAAVRAVRWLQASDRNLSRAVAWNLAEADAFLGRPSGMKPEVIKKITARDLLRFGDPAIPERYFAERGYLHRMFLLLQEKGRIDRVVAWERIRKSVNMTLLDTILSAPGRYRLGTFEYDLR
jgi:NitT/TauT family transport system substrate-binding protein